MLYEVNNNKMDSHNVVNTGITKPAYSYLKFQTVMNEKSNKDREFDTYSSSGQAEREKALTGNYNNSGDYVNYSNNAAKDSIKNRWAVTEEPKKEDYSTKEEYFKALESYRDYVNERIKNGPEKFQIGAMEMSLKEWENLLEKIDKAIEDIKASIKAEIARLEEEREAADIKNDEELEDLKVEALLADKDDAHRKVSLADRINGDFGAPYSYLADKSGIIDYNGVIFVCDNEKNQLCLGDMSNPNDVLRIPLSKGGCLMVNRDNIGDISKAISMFSPEDINLIMRAIAEDNRAQQMKNEIEDVKSRPIEENAKKVDGE